LEILAKSYISTLNNAELSGRTYSLEAKRKVVEVLILAVCCIEEFKDLVTLDVNWLDKDQFMVWPSSRIRVWGSVFGECIAAIAVPHFTEQDLPNNWGRKDFAVLPIGGLR
jgi:hypothetical protein